MAEKMCDCETLVCEQEKKHRLGNCPLVPTVRSEIYGERQNLCQRCFNMSMDGRRAGGTEEKDRAPDRAPRRRAPDGQNAGEVFPMNLAQFISEEDMLHSIRTPKTTENNLRLSNHMKLIKENYNLISNMIAEVSVHYKRMDQFEAARQTALVTLAIFSLALEEKTHANIH